MAMRPLSPLAFTISLLSASCVMALTAVSLLGVSMVDLGRVLTGSSQAL